MALEDDGNFGYRPVLEAMYEALGGLADQGYVSADAVARTWRRLS